MRKNVVWGFKAEKQILQIETTSNHPSHQYAKKRNTFLNRMLHQTCATLSPVHNYYETSLFLELLRYEIQAHESH